MIAQCPGATLASSRSVGAQRELDEVPWGGTYAPSSTVRVVVFFGGVKLSGSPMRREHEAWLPMKMRAVKVPSFSTFSV